MDYLIYISTAVKLMTDDDLSSLLIESRDLNSQRNITGMLLYCHRTFIQVLEGDIADIDRTFASIKRDSRHRDVQLMITGPISYRSFADWSMGFSAVKSTDLIQVRGYLDPKNQTQVAQKINGPHPSITLMKSFLVNNIL
ncbi:FAD-dependent sensor of blue light [Mucilaginibacter yixingensis]|uniref:FAD-dependent sensor of blue light n=1 Tax=Mucilaginibacter yixingensis TaxID=1295612 RepID=A0A2T5JA60_9SPHI|nr:BLUF domain-containing protein [Mucilaginibacter yixingensis]PTQ96946.1 FAD-dependent sensor of blue light [Mucilaginibacter yixingensis]